MSKNVRARLLAVVLVLMMVLGMFPAGALAADLPSEGAPPATSPNEDENAAKDDITVYISYQNGGFIIPKQQVTVSPELAEQYSYDNGVADGVSALDVLVKAHEVYFNAFINDGAFTEWLPTALTMSSSGSITRLFDVRADSSVLVNGEIPGDGSDFYIVPEMEIKSNDYVEFLVYKEPFMGMDYYTWFENAQGEISAVTVEAGKELPLCLKGDVLLFAMFGYPRDKDGIYNEYTGVLGKDLTIVTLDPLTGAVKDVIADEVDDEDGSFTVTFNTPGEYVLSALGDTDEIGRAHV